MDLQRRWSGAGNAPEGRVVTSEILPSPDQRDENSPLPDDEPGLPHDRPVEPLSLSSSANEELLWHEQIAQPPSQPEDTDGESRQEQGRRQEWCAIVFAQAKREGEFRVVVLGQRGERRVVARSSPFRAPRSGQLRRRGRAKEAHDLLFGRLLVAGWRPAPSRGRWHDAAFTRSVSTGVRPVERLLVICRPRHLAGSFQAVRLNDLGNSTIAAESLSFRTIRVRGSMKLGRRGAKAHQALMERLQADGWQATGITGTEWYTHVLERPAGLRSVP